MDYGIAVRNKFELFLDDEDADPLEILRLKEEENSKKKDEVKGKDAKSLKDSKSAKNKKNNKAQTTVQDQKSKPVDSKDVRKDDKPLRNKRNDDRPNRPPRENRDRDLPPRRRQEQDGRPMSTGGFGQQTSPSGGDQFRERGEGRGRGRGRGGRGGGRGRGGFDRFGKREFERHSGSDKTGIKATEKREGGGAHNWGTVKDDVEEELNKTAPTEGNPEWAAQSEDTENVQPETATETEEAVPEEEQAPSEMTLDEWKALQTKEKRGSGFNVRKPGEGCDSKQWSKTYVLKKKVNEDDEEESEEEEEDDDMDHRKKNLVPIEITFGDSSRRGGGGRGGRGRGGRGGMDRRGRGGRGSGPSTGGRGGRREQAPNVEDELDFPSLGKPAA